LNLNSTQANKFFPFATNTRKNFITNNKTFNNENNQIPNLQTILSNKFCVSPNLQKKFFAEKTATNKYSIELLLPNFNKFTMDINENLTFKDVANSIQKNFKFENIEFRTWDHSNIALGNDLITALLSSKFIFLKIDSFEWQLMNYSNIRNKFSEAFDDCK
jgi:hypothetical protein